MRNPSTTLLTGLLLTGLVLSGGCTGEESSDAVRSAGGAGWADLRRPLQIEPLPTSARCPVTKARRLSPRFAAAQGTGPVYPVGAAGDGLEFIYPVRRSQGWYPSEWGGNKVAWFARPDFAGRVLIRGGRRDGAEGVRFGDESQPQRELRLTFTAEDRGEGGWLFEGTFTRVRAPGCYAWQLDGDDFTSVITFRAICVP
jgi:hypothetical protein